MSVEDVTVARWKRFGHDRAYATHADGTSLGYRDLASGSDHPEPAADADLLRRAVDAWAAIESLVASMPDPAVAPDAITATVMPLVPAWTDLASNPPGVMARAQAIAEWERRKSARRVMPHLERLFNVHTDERSWRKGADGEEVVGARLERLAAKDPRWRFLHAVPVGSRGSDIDHVAIGPAGVLTINAKHHDKAKVWIGGDTLMVNGHRQPYVRNSRHEAMRASRLLTGACGFEVSAVGVIAIVGGVEIKTKAPPADVSVVRQKDLNRWLRRLPVILGEDRIERIYDQARRSTTWACS
ncbi:nuclease-related domain-containing protein [Nocardioides vastitatis]|uniref:Nuclease-related domain-containing protein n=2 Tax=Nocardioides vastitatis TaxID=2568655 RepID=A0ABW0ZEZ8_9ACTN|nr:nuclease-related domain-containing protein [Nocardioides sp.]